MTVMYAGAYAPAYHSVTYTSCRIDTIILLMTDTWLHEACRMEINIQEKIVRQEGYLKGSYQDAQSKKNIKFKPHFMLENFSEKSWPLWRNVEKYGKARQATRKYNMAREHYMLDT